MSTFSALERQRQIFLSGISGQRPAVPVSYDALEAAARRRLRPEAFAYIAGGAGGERTVERNRQAFDRWAIVPRMLRDMIAADTGISLFGRHLPAPLLLAPVGVLELAHAEADLAVARAAGGLGLPFVFSNQASVAMEETAAAMGGAPRWFQLYWSKDRELVASFVQRAEACGCDAIVVTLDTTMLGWRPRDLDLAYLPFLRGMGIAQYISDPVFQRRLDEPEEAGLVSPRRRINRHSLSAVLQLMRRYPGGTLANLRSGRPLRAVRQFINTYTNPSLSWDDLPFLREHTKLPILLKGILHPDDARQVVDRGIDGLWISNHGGRQVDGAVATLEMLPALAEAVGGQIPLILDSGVRGGADVCKALALGASAVAIGRPYAYGLGLAGEDGVREVLENLWAELELTMRLSGRTSVAELNRELLVEIPG